MEDNPSEWEHILNIIPRKKARNDIQGTSGNTAAITEGQFISLTISELVSASELSQTKAGRALGWQGVPESSKMCVGGCIQQHAIQTELTQFQDPYTALS